MAQRVFPDRVGKVAAVTEIKHAPASSRMAFRAVLGQQPHILAMVGTEGKLTPCLSLTRERYTRTSLARRLILASNRSART